MVPLPGGAFSGQPMQIDSECCGLIRLQALGQQTGDDARQHIPRTAGSHTGMPGDVNIGPPFGRCYYGMGSFEYKDYPMLNCVRQCQSDPVPLHLRC